MLTTQETPTAGASMPDSPDAIGGTNLRNLLLLLSGGLLLWLLAASTARLHWGNESYYNFGWAVPFLAAFLFYRRYRDMPAPDSPGNSVQAFAIVCSVLLILLAVPVRLIGEVNVIWRVPLVGQALVAFMVSLLAIYVAGGKSWLRHFWFPCFFLLTMFPWPYRLENQSVQALTGLVTIVTEGALQFLGYPAVAQGNVVNVGETVIGVEEACSGIRSLQVLTMAGLFLGEFFRLGWGRRILLLALTLGTVLLFNSTRSLVLSLIVIEQGSEAYDRWHDNVGMLTFLPNLVVVYVLGELLAWGKKDPEPTEQCLAFIRSTKLPRTKLLILPLSAALFLGASVEGWFRYHEIAAPEMPFWDFRFASDSGRDFRELEINRIVLEQLGADYATRGGFHFRTGEYAEVYVYGYDGEDQARAISSYVHSPTICMGAIGANLVEELQPVSVSQDGTELRLRHMIFGMGGQVEGITFGASQANLLHVFWNVTERQNMGVDPDRLIHNRIDYDVIFEQSLKGRRSYERKVLLVSVAGASDADSARDLVRDLLKDHLVTTAQSVDIDATE